MSTAQGIRRETEQSLVMEFGDARMPYLLGSLPLFLEAAAALQPDCWILIADDNPLVLSIVEAICDKLPGPTSLVPFRAGERAKALRTVEDLCRSAIDHGATRQSVVVAVGGGTVCNVAGMCAALLYRGIRLVQVPTTLMGMSDVVLSTKQGVNLAGVKNGIGTYYIPELVWCDPGVLRTLPAEEIRSGQAELIKNGLVVTPDHIPVLRRMLNPRAEYSEPALTTFVRMAVESKSRLLRDDPNERHCALVLEYGHTVGHALEGLCGGSLSHGYAVALGMRAAAHVACQLGVLGANDVLLHDELLSAAGLPLTLPSEQTAHINHAGVQRSLQLDNKRGYVQTAPSETAMVLLRSPGDPVLTGSVPLTQVSLPLVVQTAMSVLF
jgi:3-dehydroquinate synthase/2-deoxy-scyllo-inosose synthase